MRQVGFIGAGAMGLPLILRLLDGGTAVQVYDRNPAAMAAAVAAGATAAKSVLALADDNEIVFACLPTAEVCVACAVGPGGIIEGKKVRIYVEMSTMGGDCASDLANQLAARGIDFIDCPVVGGAVALEAGTIGILVSGPQAAFDKIGFALECFGGKKFYLGQSAGAAQVGKVINNVVAHTGFLALCEAVATGLKAGIDMETTIGIINQGSGRSFWTEMVFPGFILKGKFDGTGAIEIAVKDVALFIKEALRLGVPVPMANRTADLQKEVLESGPNGRDTLTILHYFTDLAKVPRQG